MRRAANLAGRLMLPGLILAGVNGASAVAHVPDLDRRGAAFLGLAMGDARGAPVEMYTPAQIDVVFGPGWTLRDPLPLPRILAVRGEANYRRTRIPGWVTDDTQQTMALLLAIFAHPTTTGPTAPGFVPRWAGAEAFARLLVEGRVAHAWRGQGGTFERAVDRLTAMTEMERAVERGRLSPRERARWWWARARGRPVAPGTIFDVTRSGAGVASNGAAMRTGPLGALPLPEDVLESIVLWSGLTTHADVRAIAMSYAMFKATRDLVNDVPAATVRAELPGRVRAIERRLLDWPVAINDVDPHAASRVLGAVLNGVPGEDFDAVAAAVLRAGAPGRRPWRDRRKPVTASGSFATLSVAHALALGLADAVDPRRAMTRAVEFGDDADSVAAMLGCLLGARFGAAWIDYDLLPDRRRLYRYARAVQTGVAPETTAEFLERERVLTQRERDFQRDLPARPTACQTFLYPPEEPAGGAG